MDRVFSKDGTFIAYQKVGNGPALIIVDGALCHRKFGPGSSIARQLAGSFSVFTYDRRGRGDSGNTLPYAVDREVEDLAAVIKSAGGAASLFGISSGAALALEAANQGLPVRKLALFEAPFIVDGSRPPLPDDYLARLNSLLADNRRGEAVDLFMRLVGVPSIFIRLMRLMPSWAKLKAVAHTLPYDITIVQDNQQGKPYTKDRWPRVTVPTLVVDGGKSPEWMRHAMSALTGVLPNATQRTLEGQTHMVKAKVIAPVLAEFCA